jgi:uncharacterized protein YuzE
MSMRIDGHYDAEADIAWIRFEGWDAERVSAEETDFGLREVDTVSGQVLGLELWQASARLPEDFLKMLPPPQVGVAA